MSFGIPSLYIASADSELKNYADKFGHAACFSEKELGAAVDFIVDLSRDKIRYDEMVEKSLAAATDFNRDNAAKFVGPLPEPRFKHETTGSR